VRRATRGDCVAAAVACVLFVLFLRAAPAGAEFYCGDQSMAGNPCGAGDNRCPCCSNGGNCTWWAWHEACYGWGNALPFCPDAHNWDDYAAGSGYPVGGNPCAGAVFCCESYARPCTGGEWGHVGWVTNVFADGSVDITEMGCRGWYGVRGNHLHAPAVSPPVHYIYNPRTGGCPSCECTPGQVETRGCCDCGTQTRSCGSNCMWGGWGGCGGPDPDGGNRACDTGEKGVCADGRVRCVGGCLRCVRLVDPSDELCDARDNDCDGEEDEESPARMGETPPAWAARLQDYSFPPSLAPGEKGRAWVEFANVGQSAWKTGEVALVSEKTAAGERSALFVEGAWRAWNTPAVTAQDTPTGGLARFEFEVMAPKDAEGAVVEGFRLHGPDGAAMKCPAVRVELRIAGDYAPADADEEPAAEAFVPAGGVMTVGNGCGCVLVGG